MVIQAPKCGDFMGFVGNNYGVRGAPPLGHGLINDAELDDSLT